MRDRQRGAVPWQPDDAHVVAEVLAAELRTDAEVLREPEDLGLELEVAEPVAERRALLVGKESRYFALAYFAVFSAYSADVPPMTIARWYGGQAAVPSARIFSSRKRSIASG